MGGDKKAFLDQLLAKSMYTLVCTAARENNLDLVRYYLASSFPIFLHDATIVAPIVSAALHNNIELLQLLVQNEACAHPPSMWQALMAAIQNKHTDIAKYLLSLRDSCGFPIINVNQKNIAGKTAFDLALYDSELAHLVANTGYIFSYSDAELDALSVLSTAQPALLPEGAEAVYGVTSQSYVRDGRSLRGLDELQADGFTAWGPESAMVSATIDTARESIVRLERRIKPFAKGEAENRQSYSDFLAELNSGSTEGLIMGLPHGHPVDYYWTLFNEAWQFFKNREVVKNLVSSLKPFSLIQEYGARYICLTNKVSGKMLSEIEALAKQKDFDYNAYLLKKIYPLHKYTNADFQAIINGSLIPELPNDFIDIILEDFYEEIKRFESFKFFVQQDAFPYNSHFKILALIWAGAQDEAGLFDGVTTEFVIAQLILQIAGAAFRGYDGAQSCNLGLILRMIEALSFRCSEVRILTDRVREIDETKLTKEWVALYFADLLKKVLLNEESLTSANFVHMANHWVQDRYKEPNEMMPPSLELFGRLTEVICAEAKQSFGQDFQTIDHNALKTLHTMATGAEVHDVFQERVLNCFATKVNELANDEKQYFVILCLHLYLSHELKSLEQNSAFKMNVVLQEKAEAINRFKSQLPDLLDIQNKSPALMTLESLSVHWLRTAYSVLLSQSEPGLLYTTLALIRETVPYDQGMALAFAVTHGYQKNSDLFMMERIPQCLRTTLYRYFKPLVDQEDQIKAMLERLQNERIRQEAVRQRALLRRQNRSDDVLLSSKRIRYNF